MAGVRGIARVALDVPLIGEFDYRIEPEQAPQVTPGVWVVVPWGRGQRVGIVIELTDHTDVPAEKLRAIRTILTEAAPADRHWLALVRFASRYYHRSIGEVALPAIPKLLRTPPSSRARGSLFERARRRFIGHAPAGQVPEWPLEPQQQRALAALEQASGFAVCLLHGITGSGKTEVYLQWMKAILSRDSGSQVLMMVPEIALTPRLAGLLAERFTGVPLAVLHSGLPDGERAAHWLAAAEGRARVVLGTRLSILAPLPKLAAIVVDEEHDASYKQQEGVRYSARDLAIALAAQRRIPIVLGSATPVLESWHAARQGKYRLLELPERVAGVSLPSLRIVDLRNQKLKHGLTEQALAVIGAALERREQALVFLNRRGFAPVLSCEACGWLSQCDACSAFRVLHRIDRSSGAPPRYRLVCHHCSAEQAVPRACPTCGNVDLTPLGRGTQRIEQGLAELFPSAAVARLDRDVARRRGAAESLLTAVHDGEIDILVGTQMLAKGHDFARLSAVIVVDADGGLYSSDFRAPERLFATLMQVAGRAGRSTGTGANSEVIVQTRFPDHPLFASLARHDYPGFAARQLAERDQAGLPPFMHQALVRAEARTLAAALAFLAQARSMAEAIDGASRVQLFDPVPMAMMRIAGTERAQLLLESRSRKALHAFVDGWLAGMRSIKTQVRWQLEIDPLEI
jgi:primosomal protein N' (replication factor Y) (superfamily II helicase)